MDTHADRIYVTYKWTEIGVDPVNGEKKSRQDLNITVEIVTGEVVDLIYQIRPPEYLDTLGDPYWIKNYPAESRPECQDGHRHYYTQYEDR